MKFPLIFVILFSFFTAIKGTGNEQINGRIFTGPALQQIEFPIGGIGTGNIILGGRGDIKHIEFFNAPNRNELPPEMTFFAIHVQKQGGQTSTRILERELLPPYPNGFGIPRQQLAGLPRFREVQFTGGYPFALLDFIEESFLVQVQLLAFNPFIPLNPEDSGIPAAIFIWTVTNNTLDAVDVSLVFSMANPIRSHIKGTDGYFQNLNETIETDFYRGIKMSNSAADKDSIDFAEIAFVTTAPHTDVVTRWYRGNWWDNAQLFWNDFKSDGRLTPVTDAQPTDRRETDVASLLVSCHIEPGASCTIPFYLCWFVPNRTTGSDYALGQRQSMGKVLRNYYTTRFNSVLDVVDCLVRRQQELYSKTKKYHDRLFQSTFPGYVLDAVSANSAALQTNLLMRVDSGDLHGFEGLGNDFGCCAGTCTHVWNYEQTMASLFPTLEQNARKVAFMHDTFDNGFQAHRSVFPLGEYWFDGPPAADGQMGNIVRVYREWKNCGDSQCLKMIWPKVKAALEFAWKGVGDVPEELKWQKNSMALPWDPNKDGVIEGCQQNTYDIDFYGPNSMIGSLYLAALKAAAEMAQSLGEPDKAAEYLAVYESGRKRLEEILWNGEYYIQQIEVMPGLHISKRLQSPPDEYGNIIPKYQYGDGCLSDQLLGQYLAFNSGLGYILEKERVYKAMQSIYKYNYIKSLRDYDNVQRVYGINEEGGLMTCTWPKGNRPLLPFVYADEVWTGIEYQAAATMIYCGLVQEGLRVVETVRNRYAGWNRNPFSEIESGFYYARSMASWSLLLALSGFQYDGLQHTMAFAPKINQNDFYTFWSCASGWGGFAVNKNSFRLSTDYGQLTLNEFSLEDYDVNKVKSILLNNKSINAKIITDDKKLTLRFRKSVTLLPGDVLTASFE